jgi:hypothetical protein
MPALFADALLLLAAALKTRPTEYVYPVKGSTQLQIDEVLKSTNRATGLTTSNHAALAFDIGLRISRHPPEEGAGPMSLEDIEQGGSPCRRPA